MKYALLKRPDGQIVIINNSTHIGKSRVEKLCNDGAVGVGTIESDLEPGQLKCGFEHTLGKRYEDLRDTVLRAKMVLDGDTIWSNGGNQ